MNIRNATARSVRINAANDAGWRKNDSTTMLSRLKTQQKIVEKGVYEQVYKGVAGQISGLFTSAQTPATPTPVAQPVASVVPVGIADPPPIHPSVPAHATDDKKQSFAPFVLPVIGFIVAIMIGSAIFGGRDSSPPPQPTYVLGG